MDANSFLGYSDFITEGNGLEYTGKFKASFWSDEKRFVAEVILAPPKNLEQLNNTEVSAKNLLHWLKEQRERLEREAKNVAG